MFKKSQYTKGFTLLELLVVISIIGILMAMGVVAYSTAQKKGRDARRRADLEAIQDAQEQYYAANGRYASQSLLTTSGFLNTWPKDPKSQSPYNQNLAPDGSTYCVCTAAGALEESGKGNSDNGSCTAFDNSGNEGYFCVKNLQ